MYVLLGCVIGAFALFFSAVAWAAYGPPPRRWAHRVHQARLEAEKQMDAAADSKRAHCGHANAVPVDNDVLGRLAWWCPDCETQLPPEFDPEAAGSGIKLAGGRIKFTGNVMSGNSGSAIRIGGDPPAILEAPSFLCERGHTYTGEWCTECLREHGVEVVAHHEAEFHEIQDALAGATTCPRCGEARPIGGHCAHCQP